MAPQDVEVSSDCLDMLTRVLVAAPAKRMAMEQIKAHRWFLKGLPPGALEMNDFLLQGLAGQEEVCQRLAKAPSCMPFALARQPPFLGELTTCVPLDDSRSRFKALGLGY